MRIEKNIVMYAKENRKLKELANCLGYSERNTRRICMKIFKRSFKSLQGFLVYSRIIEMHLNGYSNSDIANVLFGGNKYQLFAYVKKISGMTLRKIKTGGHRMTKEELQILEAKVITKLACLPEGENITLKKLGVPRCIISNLREKGYEIISVPGRYNGGYNLGKTSKVFCLSWINKIRVNRFGLPGNYSF